MLRKAKGKQPSLLGSTSAWWFFQRQSSCADEHVQSPPYLCVRPSYPTGMRRSHGGDSTKLWFRLSLPLYSDTETGTTLVLCTALSSPGHFKRCCFSSSAPPRCLLSSMWHYDFKKGNLKLAQWYQPEVSALRKLKQEDCQELKASLGYRVRLSLKIYSNNDDDDDGDN